jgi:protein transport protein SEC24
MVRPPQPPVYFFVIDVSSVSASTGMLQSCITSIKAALDELPGGTRTQIGFVTFDSAIHFYNLKSTLSSPQMHVISDVTDIILPLPEDLLVNLSESRKVVESLLDSLPNLFKNN